MAGDATAVRIGFCQDPSGIQRWRHDRGEAAVVVVDPSCDLGGDMSHAVGHGSNDPLFQRLGPVTFLPTRPLVSLLLASAAIEVGSPLLPATGQPCVVLRCKTVGVRRDDP